MHWHLAKNALGWMGVAVTDHGFKRLVFGHASPDDAVAAFGGGLDPVDPVGQSRQWIAWLSDFAAGEDAPLAEIPLDLRGFTPFRRRVTEACRQIPRGQVRSYQDLAAACGSSAAARAVGSVMRRNPLPLVVPCHRVVGASGKLHGFSAPGGLEMKARLLDLERVESCLG